MSPSQPRFYSFLRFNYLDSDMEENMTGPILQTCLTRHRVKVTCTR